MKTILVTAYDINPYRGSEAGMGWNFSKQIARYHKAIIITRKNNRENIEKYIEEFQINAENLNFQYYDLPYWMRFWKKGGRGAWLYFYLWQLFMPLFVKKRGFKFDIAHNLNFHTASVPSMLWMLGKPFIWGPINHNEKIPKNYIKNVYTFKEYLRDRMAWMGKQFFWYLDPFHFMSRNLAKKVIGANSSVQKRLRIPAKKFVIIPSAGTDKIEGATIRKRKDIFHVLVVGRFMTIKAFDAAILAFGAFYDQLPKEDKPKIKMTILGKGEKKEYLRNIADRLAVRPQITFLEWVEKKDMRKMYEDSDVFFFPTHEGAGMVVPEALSMGLPVLCFDNAGPGEFVNESCAIAVPYTNYQQSVQDFALALRKMYDDKPFFEKLSEGALITFDKKFDWNSRGEMFKEIYEEVI